MHYLQQYFAPHFLVALATLVCIGVYWDGLYGPLLLDDISNLGNILKADFGPDDILPNLFSESGPLKRPVSMLTFIINGLYGNNLFYWKLTNLSIHLINGILLFLFTKKLIQFVNPKDNLTAAIVAAVWILHPLQVSTVLYTVQRMTELSALFVFAALLTYIIARQRQKKGIIAWPMQAVTWLVFFPLGLLSKENALLFPAFILLLEVFILNREKINNQQLLKLTLFSILFSAAVIYAKSEKIIGGYITRSFTLPERLYTESRILIDYIGMLLTPAQSRMGFAHDDVIISHGLMNPWTTLPSILIITALIAASFFLRRNFPLIGFGILFFFLGHTMESTIIPLELMYEHRNYLPSFGILLATVIALKAIVKNRTTLISFAVLLFSLLIFITYARAQTWSSTQSLYYYMEITHPRSERLATIKATQYTSIGMFPKAHDKLKGFSSLGAKLQRLNIDCAETHTLENHKFDISLDESSLADNYAIIQLTDLANSGLDNECAFSGIAFIALLKKISGLRSISRNNKQMVFMYLAHYLWQENQKIKALRVLHEAFTINKNNPIPLFLACEWMIDTNKLDDANKTCNKALDIVKNTPFNKYKNLADKVKGRLNSLPD